VRPRIARRFGDVVGQDFREVPDDAVGRPRGETDSTAGFRHASGFRAGAGRVRREDVTEVREDHVERVVRDRKGLGVAGEPADIGFGGERGVVTGQLEHSVSEIEADDVRAARRAVNAALPVPQPTSRTRLPDRSRGVDQSRDGGQHVLVPSRDTDRPTRRVSPIDRRARWDRP